MIDWKEIQKYYDAGHTIKDCMSKFSIRSFTTFSRASKKNLFVIRSKSEQQLKRKLKINDSLKSEINELYNSGHSLREVADKLKLKVSVVRRCVNSPRSYSESLKLRLQKHGSPMMSAEAKASLSKRMSENNPGGKSKWYEVSGIKVQGTWERDFAIYLNELGIKWERCKPIKYKMDGKIRRYTPDFYLPEKNLYVEVKGHWWGDDKRKMTCVIEQHKDKEFLIIENQEYDKISKGS